MLATRSACDVTRLDGAKIKDHLEAHETPRSRKVTTINYLLSLSSTLLTAPGKQTVFLSCSLSLMLMLGSSAYGRLYPKRHILLSATIRQSREKSEMTSRQTTFSFSGYQKRCITLCSPLVIPLITFMCKASSLHFFPQAQWTADLTIAPTLRRESNVLLLNLIHIPVSQAIVS